jgi:hypothetical protein
MWVECTSAPVVTVMVKSWFCGAWAEKPLPLLQALKPATAAAAAMRISSSEDILAIRLPARRSETANGNSEIPQRTGLG